MKEFWEQRYSSAEYVYGTLPNDFFAEELIKLKPGRVLLPADGEGRNSVFAASQGWEADAFDFSPQARIKALELAVSANCKINYFISDITTYTPPEACYDLVGLIFVHLPEPLRRRFHETIMTAINPGGILLLEAYHKDQIKFNTGGPRDVSLLYDEFQLQEDFEMHEVISISRNHRQINERILHKGMSETVQCIIRKAE